MGSESDESLPRRLVRVRCADGLDGRDDDEGDGDEGVEESERLHEAVASLSSSMCGTGNARDACVVRGERGANCSSVVGVERSRQVDASAAVLLTLLPRVADVEREGGEGVDGASSSSGTSEKVVSESMMLINAPLRVRWCGWGLKRSLSRDQSATSHQHTRRVLEAART